MTTPRSGTRGFSAVPERVAVPRLDGVLSDHEADLVAASSDFGHQVYRRPLAVLHPGSAEDVAAIVRFGRDRAIPVVARGEGHSVDGQAQVRNGIVVRLGSLAQIRKSGPDRISVDAGARWSAVVDATLPHGSLPPVLPDYLELSVGGTLSAGGIGGASHRYGCQADNVLDLDVVTPAGKLLNCSPTRNSELFDAVRGTQGRHGIITRATLALRPAHPMTRRYLLGYQDLATLLADQRRLIEDQRFDHVLGQVQPAEEQYAGGPVWRYVLDAATTFTPAVEPDDRELVGDLAHDRATEVIATTGHRDFLYRLAPLEARFRSVGSWQHDPHPRCTLLLPGRHAESIMRDALDQLTAADLGHGGGILVYPIPTGRLVAPHMPKARDDLTVVFGVQRTAPPDDPAVLDRMRQGNAMLYAAALRSGGAGYASPGLDDVPGE